MGVPSVLTLTSNLLCHNGYPKIAPTFLCGFNMKDSELPPTQQLQSTATLPPAYDQIIALPVVAITGQPTNPSPNHAQGPLVCGLTTRSFLIGWALAMELITIAAFAAIIYFKILAALSVISFFLYSLSWSYLIFASSTRILVPSHLHLLLILNMHRSQKECHRQTIG